MLFYNNDFEEEDLGILPLGLSEPLGGLLTTTIITEESGSKFLTITQILGGQYRLDLGLDTEHNHQSIEVRARSNSTSGDQIGVILRALGDGSCYFACLEEGDTFTIGRFDATTRVALDSVSFDWKVDEWYRIKFTAFSDHLAGKVWLSDNAEPPGWDMVVSDPNYENGFLGLYKASLGVADYDEVTALISLKRRARLNMLGLSITHL